MVMPTLKDLCLAWPVDTRAKRVHPERPALGGSQGRGHTKLV